MKTINPRIAERRKAVAEDRARGSARRVLWLLTILAVIGGLIWVARSPWFSVANITVAGARHADVERILDEAGVRIGRPLLIVPGSAAEEALVADPWVVDAVVSKVFPDLVEVAIIERDPVATVTHRGGQVVVSEDGVILSEAVDQPLPVVRATEPLPPVGETLTELDALGGAMFFAELHPKYLPGAVLQTIDGEVWARIDEFDVRIGRPVDMAEKARSLAAVLDIGQEPGSIINVIAPARPTVLPPGFNPLPEQEG